MWVGNKSRKALHTKCLTGPGVFSFWRVFQKELLASVVDYSPSHLLLKSISRYSWKYMVFWSPKLYQVCLALCFHLVSSSSSQLDISSSNFFIVGMFSVDNLFWSWFNSETFNSKYLWQFLFFLEFHLINSQPYWESLACIWVQQLKPLWFFYHTDCMIFSSVLSTAELASKQNTLFFLVLLWLAPWRQSTIRWWSDLPALKTSTVVPLNLSSKRLLATAWSNLSKLKVES